MRPMLSKWKKVLWNYQERPRLDEGEEVLLEGRIVLLRSVQTMRDGILILTNRRLLWYEPRVTRPLRPIRGETDITEIVSVDKGAAIYSIVGGGPMRIRLRNGRRKYFDIADGKRDEWISAISNAITGTSDPSK